MGLMAIRFTDDEEKLIRNAAVAEKMPYAELIRRRVFASPEISNDNDNLRPEVEAMAATLTDLADAVATLNRQLKYAQGLSIAVLQIANPEGWKDDMQRMKALAFGAKEEAK